MKKRYIYIVISKTQTNFARCICKYGKIQYNHAAISLNQELSAMYAFARPQHNSVFLGKLVHETLDRYTLRKSNPIPIVVFRLPVSQREYDDVCECIRQILEDSEYIYNLFSVLSYPVIHGFSTYKAFTCIEFVVYVLKKLNYSLEQDSSYYTPDDLIDILRKYTIYQGDIREYMNCSEEDDSYFENLNWKMVWGNINGLIKIVKRSFRIEKLFSH